MGIYGVIPFLMLFQCGFLYTGMWSLAQGLKKIHFPNPLLRILDFVKSGVRS